MMLRRERGRVDRDGVGIAYEQVGEGAPTLLLLPAWMITGSGLWAAQRDGLGDRFRCLSFDARGSGRSDRPLEPERYQVGELVADALAVLDAAGAGRAVLVGNSLGGLVAYLVAALHPDRVAGLVLISATVDLTGDHDAPLARAIATFDEEPAGDDGWARYNRQAWRRDYPGFARWFVDTALGEEATAETRADGVRMALDTTPEVLAAGITARAGRSASGQAAGLRALAGRITCPVLVLHGDRDAVVPPAWSAALAAALDAVVTPLPGAGHCPQVTRPGEVNALIGEFAAGIGTAGAAA
ncbi:alpha/beta fold hydrolase [Jiangella sp. DSM 45060]|uniref:alpha/beta fold hydrolase n=1 Tax=Jiangella sp. DSM 45060 TaxID=1798224 RepID=UPI00087C967C|nr:alpha/beta hydrolase [Jiangella sp. DSM 45060]SDT04028.1 alpha/beta hydrolase fold [Jiangella sp. DSM 45060]